MPDLPSPEGITQTILVGDDSGKNGNCLQAATASWFTLNGWPTALEDVPDFANMGGLGAYWEQMFYGYFALRGYLLRMRGLSGKPLPDELCIVGGDSPRGADIKHVVVVKGGEVVWDPHPSRAGLVTYGVAWIPRQANELWAYEAAWHKRGAEIDRLTARLEAAEKVVEAVREKSQWLLTACADTCTDDCTCARRLLANIAAYDAVVEGQS